MRIARTLGRKALHRLGYALVPIDYARPINTLGSPTIVGSFPPRNLHSSIGGRDSYFIHAGYRCRTEAPYFDDRAGGDEWQREVYKFAREVAEREHLNTICDIGCGSGFKLLNNFKDSVTVGIDVAVTCEHLRAKWPDRKWLVWDPSDIPQVPMDLVIASDVVEHLVDPDELLLYIQQLRPKYIVISTPDRNLMRYGCHDGPPTNSAHIREWSFAEFDAYIDHFFQVEEHFISFPPQATQCILCKPKGERA